LNQYKQTFNINESDWSKILVNWLAEHSYDIIKHKDPSNSFLLTDSIISEYAARSGVCVRIVDLQSYDKITNKSIKWKSRVYEKENSFIKKGTSWLIDNEKYILSHINYPFVPKLIAHGKDEVSSWIEISRVQGENLEDFLSVRSNITMRNFRELIVSGLNHLLKIYESGVMHRDVIPGNILIYRQNKKCECNFIDFGYSIIYKEKVSLPTPIYLGEAYAPEYMFSDFYSFGKVVLSMSRKMPYLKRISNELALIQWDNYRDEEYVKAVVSRALAFSNKPMGLRDYYAFYRKKYSAWRKYIDTPLLIPKQILVRIKRILYKFI
jgi:serine/threonine protein kinase